MDVSPAYSCLIFNASTTDLCRNEEMYSKIWVIINCKRRVSKESNRKSRLQSTSVSVPRLVEIGSGVVLHLDIS